jgi:hypothetical protein
VGSALADLVTEAALRRRAGPRSFGRGSDYQTAGAASALRWDGKAISGAVDGSDRYVVRLRLDTEGRLEGRCTCPLGRAWNAALAPGRMIGWNESWGFAKGLGEVIERLDELGWVGHRPTGPQPRPHVKRAV